MATINTINVSVANDNNGDTLRNAFVKTNDNFAELNTKKVEAELGKGLSENDFTDADKAKLDAIPTGAEANVQSDWNQTDNLADDYIKNKPVVSVSLTETATGKIADATVAKVLNDKIEDFNHYYTKIEDCIATSQFTSNNGSWDSARYRGSSSVDIFSALASLTVGGYRATILSAPNLLSGNKPFAICSFRVSSATLNGEMDFGYSITGITNRTLGGYPTHGVWFECDKDQFTFKVSNGVTTSSSSTITIPTGSSSSNEFVHGIIYRNDDFSFTCKLMNWNYSTVLLDSTLPITNNPTSTSMALAYRAYITDSGQQIYFGRYGYGWGMSSLIKKRFNII